MELALVNEQSFFESKDLTTSFDDVFKSYEETLAGLTYFANFVSDKTGLVGYFLAGNKSSTYMSSELFELKGAIAALNAEYWQKVIDMTDVKNCMPADKRNEWNTNIHERKTPEFNRETVAATIGYLLASRGAFLADKVDGIFRRLSGRHVTNSPMAFREKMIFDRVLDKFGYVETQRVEYIHDLRSVIALIREQNQPKHWITSEAISAIAKAKDFGEWFDFDGGAFRIKIYKSGTAHIEVHPEIAGRLNRILATKYPAAIPASARNAEKSYKARPLQEASLSFDAAAIISDIARRVGKSKDHYVDFSELSKSVKTEVQNVLKFFGGKITKNCISFDVWPKQALHYVARTCCLPDIKSHQFYPTKSDLAEIMVDMAEVSDDHQVLEPSAGHGGIADLLPVKKNVTCVEISKANCEVLKEKGFNTVNTDFLTYRAEKFHRVVMNPPFSDNRATDHVQKAFGDLLEKGILVACLPASLKGKTLIKGQKHVWSEIYQDSFDGTSVSVVLLKIIKD